MSASSPPTSGSSGRIRYTARVSRIASADRSARRSRSPVMAVWPSVKIRYSTCSTASRRARHSSSAGGANGRSRAASRFLARVIRCAIVASGSRKARAISAVVRPPTARKVRAIALAGGSAGWQHRNSNISESSWAETDSAGSGSRRATTVSRLRRATSARTASAMRRCATWISQPRGLSGLPSTGHCVAAASSASCSASSAVGKSPKRRTSVARTCGANSRSRSSVARSAAITDRRQVRSSPHAPRCTHRWGRHPGRVRPTPRRRSRAHVPRCRRRRSSTRPGTPWSPGTGRR